MPNPEHVEILMQGTKTWNRWRRDNEGVEPDLREASIPGTSLVEANLDTAILHRANLRGAVLSGASFVGANLDEANLETANLIGANLSEAKLIEASLNSANLSEAQLTGANLSGAKLTGANLSQTVLNRANLVGANLVGANLVGASLVLANLRNANLSTATLSAAILIGADLGGANLGLAILREANLREADLSNADLRGANIQRASLVGANLEGAALTGCKVYGVSVWGLKGQPQSQEDLVITKNDEQVVTLDNLEVAQFLYLLLHNAKVRDVIETITSKVVLILGRFTPERKTVLDGIRDALRGRNYLPVLFDFDKPASRNLTETVSTLAHLSRFIIADITEPRSIPQELQRVVPDLPSVPVQPILEGDSTEYGMFEDFKQYPWVLAIHRYRSFGELIIRINEDVIEPAERKRNELLP